ncbi:nucleotide exchange factor GrpE [Candidatus Bipolaricaulota bacterium]|nr:nucleotide exchange factor GrpE [Candidatus Bipolaricaulota bacterium]
MSAKEKKSKKTELQPEIDEILVTQSEQTEETEAADELRSTIDRLQRLQAEFENYKKRALRDASVYEQRVSDRLILEFLPLYDNLERAFQSYASNQDIATFVAGTEQIFGQFKQVLETMGVAPIIVENQPFDPAVHEAMLSVASDVEKNMIIEEFTPGYTRDERVLRPSRVSVSQGPALSEEEPK